MSSPSLDTERRFEKFMYYNLSEIMELTYDKLVLKIVRNVCFC